jgi:hypothetical protein
MSEVPQASISNVIHVGIKQGIEMLLEQQCYRSAVILIYAGIDAMSFLSLPEGQQDVTRAAFIRWAEQYLHFPCQEQLTGLDLYGARCGMLHNYSVMSRLSREGKCREIGYVDQSDPEVIYNPQAAPDQVFVSIAGLAEAFFKGVDRFIIDVFGDPIRAPLARKRLGELVHSVPY